MHTSLKRRAVRARPARGLSLVEVLVAVVILAIGLLGLAGLQVSGIRVGQGANFRGQAGQLAAELSERMRANRGGFVGSSSTNCTTVTGAASAARDAQLADWRATRLAALPGASCAYAVGADGRATITVNWDDSRAGGGASSFTLVTAL